MIKKDFFNNNTFFSLLSFQKGYHCFIAPVNPTVIHQPPDHLLIPIQPLSIYRSIWCSSPPMGVDIDRFENHWHSNI